MMNSINEGTKTIFFIVLLIIGLILTFAFNECVSQIGLWIQGTSVGICISLWIDWVKKSPT